MSDAGIQRKAERYAGRALNVINGLDFVTNVGSLHSLCELSTSMSNQEFRENILGEYGLVHRNTRDRYGVDDLARNRRRGLGEKVEDAAKKYLNPLHSFTSGGMTREVQKDLVHSLAEIYAAEQQYNNAVTNIAPEITSDDRAAEIAHLDSVKDRTIKGVIKEAEYLPTKNVLMAYVLDTGKLSVQVDENNIPVPPTAVDYGALKRETVSITDYVLKNQKFEDLYTATLIGGAAVATGVVGALAAGGGIAAVTGGAAAGLGYSYARRAIAGTALGVISGSDGLVGKLGSAAALATMSGVVYAGAVYGIKGGLGWYASKSKHKGNTGRYKVAKALSKLAGLALIPAAIGSVALGHDIDVVDDYHPDVSPDKHLNLLNLETTGTGGLVSLISGGYQSATSSNSAEGNVIPASTDGDSGTTGSHDSGDSGNSGNSGGSGNNNAGDSGTQNSGESSNNGGSGNNDASVTNGNGNSTCPTRNCSGAQTNTGNAGANIPPLQAYTEDCKDIDGILKSGGKVEVAIDNRANIIDTDYEVTYNNSNGTYVVDGSQAFTTLGSALDAASDPGVKGTFGVNDIEVTLVNAGGQEIASHEYSPEAYHALPCVGDNSGSGTTSGGNGTTIDNNLRGDFSDESKWDIRRVYDDHGKLESGKSCIEGPKEDFYHGGNAREYNLEPVTGTDNKVFTIDDSVNPNQLNGEYAFFEGYEKIDGKTELVAAQFVPIVNGQIDLNGIAGTHDGVNYTIDDMDGYQVGLVNVTGFEEGKLCLEFTASESIGNHCEGDYIVEAEEACGRDFEEVVRGGHGGSGEGDFPGHGYRFKFVNPGMEDVPGTGTEHSHTILSSGQHSILSLETAGFYVVLHDADGATITHTKILFPEDSRFGRLDGVDEGTGHRDASFYGDDIGARRLEHTYVPRALPGGMHKGADEFNWDPFAIRSSTDLVSGLDVVDGYSAESAVPEGSSAGGASNFEDASSSNQIGLPDGSVPGTASNFERTDPFDGTRTNTPAEPVTSGDSAPVTPGAYPDDFVGPLPADDDGTSDAFLGNDYYDYNKAYERLDYEDDEEIQKIIKKMFGNVA